MQLHHPRAQCAAEVGDRLRLVQVRDQDPARGRLQRADDRGGLRLGEVFPVHGQSERDTEGVDPAVLEQRRLGAVADAGDLEHGRVERNAHEGEPGPAAVVCDVVIVAES